MNGVNLRNKPIDRRRLKREDRRQLNDSNRQRAFKLARKRRGQAAYFTHRPPNTTLKYKGRNQFAPGIWTQQMRLRQVGQDRRRAESFRPEMPSKPTLQF